jgi:hypothetical protein
VAAKVISSRVSHATARRVGRDVTIFSLSAAVMGLLVLYAVAGSGLRLAAVADRARTGGGAGAVVSGRVLDESGNGVKHVRVLVAAATRTPRRAFSSPDGLFRIGLAGSCERYEIRLTAEVHARTLATHLRRRLCPGELLRIRARVVSSGQLLWFPR